MVYKIIVRTTNILLVFLLMSCDNTPNNSTVVTLSPDTQVNSIDTTPRVIAGSILIAYKTDVKTETIVNFEKSLPEHVKKSLGSQIMFSYRFLSVKNIVKAQGLFKNASIVDSISQDKVFKMDPGF